MLKFYSHHDFGGPESTRSWLTKAGWQSIEDPHKADVIIFNGGSDIAAEIYKEASVGYGVPMFKSVRDDSEIALYEEVKDTGKFILGICRGAQLLNCLNGGTLWQDVDNHQRDHYMVDIPTGKTFLVTSTHHQMMRPNLGCGEIIGLSSESTIKRAYGVTETFVPVDNLTKQAQDVEVVWYPDHLTLCVQGHPEYVPNSIFAEYVLNMVLNVLDGRELSEPRKLLTA